MRSNFKNRKGFSNCFILISSLLLTIIFSSCEKEAVPSPLEEVCTITDCFNIIRFEDNIKEFFIEFPDMGYSYSIYYKTQLVRSGAGGFRSRAIDPESERRFDLKTNLHIASVSKPLTTIAALKLMEAKGIKIQDKIAKYLPPYWVKGKNIEQITFKDLLTHRSGIRSGDMNYQGLKRIIASGIETSHYGTFFYQNANFCLFRILIPAMEGYTFPNGALNEPLHDVETQQRYIQNVNRTVLQPLNIKADCKEDVLTSYLFASPYNFKPGVRTGNLSPDAGGFGWYFNAVDLGKVFAFVNSTDQVLSATARQQMFSQQLGCFAYIHPQYGTAYHHNGGWVWCTPHCGELHTVQVMFPNDITVAIICNAGPFNYPNGITGLVLDSWLKAFN